MTQPHPRDVLRDLSVLIVDDDAAAAEDLEALLKERAASVEIWTGSNLSRALRSGRYDVAVIGADDKGDGLALCDRLREDIDEHAPQTAPRSAPQDAHAPPAATPPAPQDATPPAPAIDAASSLKVIVASAEISRESLEKHAATLTGADAYLRKPFDEQRTQACFERLQRGTPSRAERLWWLDDRTNPLSEPISSAGAHSGSPVGIPGFKP